MKWKFLREHHRRQDKAHSGDEAPTDESDNDQNTPLYAPSGGDLFHVTVTINRKRESWTMRAPNAAEARERLVDLGYRVIAVVACD